MKYVEARPGRVYVIRLEDGETIHEVIEEFAHKHGIRAATLVVVGGADKDSRLVVGPKDGRAEQIESQELLLDEAHEVAGTGTIFPDECGKPILHMHLAAGRGDRSVTGCVRQGVKVWHVLEVILLELVGTRAMRKLDPKLGFKLLEPSP